MRRQRQMATHKRLAKAIQERGSYRAVATGLPIHFSHLQKIAQGKREPGLGLAIVLEKEGLGVVVEDWPSLRQSVKELLRMRGAAA